MRRRSGRLLAVAAGLLVALPLAVVVVLASLDLDRHRGRIAAELAALTGREVAIDGPIELALSLSPTLSVEGLRLANATWGSEQPMLRVRRLELAVEVLPLLGGELALRTVEHIARGINVFWHGDTGTAAPGFALDRLRLERAHLRYRDASGADLALSLRELTLVAPSMDGPLVVAARGDLAGEAVTVSGRLRTPAALLAGEAVATELLVELEDLRLRGEATLPAAGGHGSASARLEAKDVARLLSAGAALLAPLPRPAWAEGLGPVVVEAQLEGGDASVAVRDLSLEAGETRLAGNARFSWAEERPRLQARIGGERLDLAAVSFAGGGGSPRLFGEQALPWSALERVDGELALDIADARIGPLALTPLRVSVTADGGRVRVTPELGLFGGTLGGELGVNAAARTLAAALRGRDVALGELLASLGAGERLSGAPTSLQLDVATGGDTPRALASAADGGLLLQVGAGRLPAGALGWLGGDLALTLARSLGLGGEDMQLECGVVNFDLAGGVLSGEDGIGFRFDRMNVVGGGSVDLGRERLDLQLAPETREGVGLSPGSTLAGMVALRGSLTEPQVEVSGEGLAKAGAKVGAAVVTGGLSLLASALYERLTAEADVCRGALEGTATTGGEATPAPTAEPARVTRPRPRDD